MRKVDRLPLSLVVAIALTGSELPAVGVGSAHAAAPRPAATRPAGRPSTAPAKAPAKATAPADTNANANSDVSPEAARAFAKKMEAALAAGDGSVFAKVVDAPAIIDTAVAGLDAPPDLVRGVRMGAATALNKMGADIVRATQAGGSYRLLRVHGEPGKRRALFRMLLTEGLNYHDLHLAPSADGGVRIVDIDIILSGEPMTQSIRRMILPLVADAKRGRVARLLTKESDVAKHMPEVLRAQQLTREGKAAESLAILDRLPESIRGEKIIMIYRLMNSSKLGEDTYVKALAEFDRKFPDDPSGLLIRLDSLFLSKKFDELLVAIDRLDKRIGGDPYLDVYRANAHVGKGDAATARKFTTRLLKAEPTLPMTYFTAIGVALAQKDHAGVAQIMDAATANGIVSWSPEKIESAEEFRDFAKSKEYREWKERQPQEQPKQPGKPDGES